MIKESGPSFSYLESHHTVHKSGVMVEGLMLIGLSWLLDPCLDNAKYLECQD